MENVSLETEAIPESSEKDGTEETMETIPEASNEIFVPVKFNKQIRNLELDKAAELAQKGLKFEAIAADYDNLKRIAAENGKSV